MHYTIELPLHVEGCAHESASGARSHDPVGSRAPRPELLLLLYYLYYLYSGALLFVADAAVHAHVYSSLTQGIKISAVWDRSDLLLMGLGQVRGTEKARW